jgi:hypothetical protein
LDAGLNADVLRGASDQYIKRARFHDEAVGFHIPESELLAGKAQLDGLREGVFRVSSLSSLLSRTGGEDKAKTRELLKRMPWRMINGE